HLKKGMLDLRARLDELETLSTCPTCKRTMDGHHKKRLRDELTGQGTQLRDEFRANEAACRELDGLISHNEDLLAKAAAALLDREAIHRRLVQTEGLIAHTEEAVRQAALLEKELAERQRALGTEAFAPDARRELARVDRQMAQLGYDEQRHAELRTRASQ